ncbi:hypothetical protein [Actinomadura livida]|uniref:Uncharacterized protein n=1 Tax=Actinomadura livida TaxID=79909 RepID=A0A7W7I8V2_9ACTN|nr:MULTISPECIES: hypothetical protein [Actinomadura]MBB4772661.1 hypothetical protein [Actinomadura catellatispora]GGU11946.1 hypothetical protein GCM10010208_40750 [Actinomadura livida]
MNRQPPSEGVRLLLTAGAIVLAVILVVTGLAVIGGILIAVAAMSNLGSNK